MSEQQEVVRQFGVYRHTEPNRTPNPGGPNPNRTRTEPIEPVGRQGDLPSKAYEALRFFKGEAKRQKDLRKAAESEIADLLRARRASLDSINLDRPDMVYQVVAGAPSGTYLVISPLPSVTRIASVVESTTTR